MFEFKKDKDYRFTWPVSVLVPTEDGQKECEFTGRFRLLAREAIDKSTADDPVNADENLGKLAMTGWGDDLVQDGKPLPYSVEARDELLKLPFVRLAVARAYWNAVSGALRRKNSDALPVAG